MLRMEIEFDSNKILQENILKEPDLFKQLDLVIVDHLHLHKIEEGVYGDTGRPGDLTKFMGVMSWLQQANWFQHYASRWDWYNDRLGTETNVTPENLLEV